MFGRLRRQIGAIALFILVLVPGAYGMPDESVSAGHCLAAPTSTAPEGTHCFYRLDLRSALRCWYLRVLGQSEQSTVAQDRPTDASRPHTLHRRRPALVHGASETEHSNINSFEDRASSRPTRLFGYQSTVGDNRDCDDERLSRAKRGRGRSLLM
jgi:hypothetical protein